MKRVLSFVLCLMLVLPLLGCGAKKVNEDYIQHLAGKTFISAGSVVTFYKEGIATYDYNEHHYGYRVSVTEVTEEQIKLSMETVVIQSDDYIDRGPEEAIYSIADNTLFYYRTYDCLFDPGNSDHFSNTGGAYDTVCAQEGCRLFIALSGHTVYCSEHAACCEFCGDYVDPGVTYCEGCPHCYDCGAKIAPGEGIRCASCKQKLPSNNQTSSGKGKCYICNGTGYVKYYYGSSDWEAYLNGHDPYWFGKCTSCGGTGKD